MTEGIASGTSLNRDDAVVRALRFLLLREAYRITCDSGLFSELEGRRDFAWR
jgi:hypothetical protein